MNVAIAHGPDDDIAHELREEIDQLSQTVDKLSSDDIGVVYTE